MSFASRSIGWASNQKALTLVGVSALQVSSTVSFPVTALKGDVAVMLGSSDQGGTQPSGWTKLHADDSRSYYRICTGGESSVASPYSSGSFIVFLLRPVGGVALLSGSRSGAAGTAQASLTATATGPAVLVSNCMSTVSAGVSFAAPSYSPGYTVHANVGSPNPILVLSAPIAAGAGTGSLNLTCTTSPNRQTHGLFQCS